MTLREAKGNRPRQLSGAAFNGWTWDGRRRRKPSDQGLRRPLSSPRKYGPEAQNRRSGAPDGAASFAGMSTPERMRPAMQAGSHARREFTDAPVGAPLPRVCLRGRKKTGAPEPDPNTG